MSAEDGRIEQPIARLSGLPMIQGLREDGSAIAALYACGNDMASIMNGNYPGPGITLGPALTFGYIAGRHLAQIGSEARAQQKEQV
jgi:succinate dehydrogenase/fumarate reductase flavoprotein subunit